MRAKEFQQRSWTRGVSTMNENATNLGRAPLENTSEALFDEMMDTNFRGAYSPSRRRYRCSAMARSSLLSAGPRRSTQSIQFGQAVPEIFRARRLFVLIPEAELASARRDMGEDRYASEFECNPDSPIVGSYYGSLMRDADREGRVVPDLEIIDGPIHPAWDLGHGSNMAVFAFQIGDDGLLVHDFIQEDGWFFTDYIEEVKRRGYTGKCYVPHDISVKSFESGRTRVQTLASAGLNPVPVPMHNVPDRINAAQLTIQSICLVLCGLRRS
jgi:hypothetical protein